MERSVRRTTPPPSSSPTMGGGELKLLPPSWGKRDVIDRCSSRSCVRCAGGSLRKCCTRAIRGPVVRLGMVTEAFVLMSCEKKAGLNRSEGSADASKHGEGTTSLWRTNYSLFACQLRLHDVVGGEPLEGVPRLYDQRGVLRVKGKEHLIWTPPPSVGEDEGGGDVLRKIEGVDTGARWGW